jgi:hypothetical protein
VIAAFTLFFSLGSAYAADNNQVVNLSISVQNIFSMEFYTDQNVVFSGTVPFTNVDPSKTLVYPDGRKENDGKSDVGILCKSNLGAPWVLKLQLTPAIGLAPEKVKYYMDQPYNRNTGQRADGTLSKSTNWYPMSSNPISVYSSGYLDQSNLPFGTLAVFSYALDPTGLDAGKTYNAVVTYTMTTTP